MRVARALALFAAVFLCLGSAAAAQEVDAQEVEKIVGGLNLELLQAAGEEAGVDVGQMILDVATGAQKFDAQEAWDRLVDELAGQLRAAVRLTALMVVPALLSAIARQFCGGARASSAVSQVAYLVCAANLAAWFVRLTAQAREMIARVAALADAVFPVLAALLSLSGATASAAAVTPLSALAGNAFADLLSGAGLSLCAIAAALAIAAHLSPRLRLEKMFSLCRAALNWLAGVLMTGFLGLSAVKALLSSGYDSAAVRTARYAVDNLLPVVGGEVANTMDALVSSVLLVKNAAGVSGLVVLALTCARPLLTLASALAALRLASALLEPVADDALIALTDKFGQVAGMLLVVCASGAVILTLLVGGTLLSGQGLVR